MSRKRAGLVVRVVAGVAAVTLAASPLASGAKGDAKHLTLFSVPSDVEFFYIKDMDGSGNGPYGDPTVGDLVFFRTDFSTALDGPPLARWRGASCVITGDQQEGNLDVACAGTIAFEKGSLALAWSSPWGDLVSSVSIVGGTGVYRNAGGDGTIDLTQAGAPITLRITG